MMPWATPKLKRIVDIVFEEGPANAGDSPSKSSIANGQLTREKALEIQERARGFICCFDDREKMKRVLKRIADEDLGISIVISGLIDEVMEMAREVGIKPHTIALSMGIWGKKELLPGPEILEFTTMCGHALVSSKLVKKAMDEVKASIKTPEEAARMLGMPCICGIVNLTKAAEMLAEMAAG